MLYCLFCGHMDSRLELYTKWRWICTKEGARKQGTLGRKWLPRGTQEHWVAWKPGDWWEPAQFATLQTHCPDPCSWSGTTALLCVSSLFLLFSFFFFMYDSRYSDQLFIPRPQTGFWLFSGLFSFWSLFYHFSLRRLTWNKILFGKSRK